MTSPVQFKAGLAYDTPSSIEYTTKYTQENQTLADQEWEAIATGHGSIALDQESIKAWNLPPAQEFVWDESKSVYVLNAYHSLHCLVCRSLSPKNQPGWSL